MKMTRDVNRMTIAHIRGFGVNPEDIKLAHLAQSIEDKSTPLEAAQEAISYLQLNDVHLNRAK